MAQTNSILITVVLFFMSLLATGQALDDSENTAFDYILYQANVSQNDNLPAGTRTHRFLNEPALGSIQWIDSLTGIFGYLVDPINVQLYFEQGPAARMDSIYYEVCVQDYCDTALIEVFIAFLPDIPVAIRDTFYVETGSMRWCDVSINDYDADSISDPNRGAYRFFNVSNPQHINIELSELDSIPKQNGTFLYIPEDGFLGEDSFLYSHWEPAPCDRHSPPCLVTIFVVPENASPFASQINLGNINEETTRNQNLAFYTFDPVSEPLTYRIIQQGIGGIAFTFSNGAMTYTAATNFIGPDTIYYEVMDLVGQTDTAAIILNVVNANNDAPLALHQSYTTSEDITFTTSIAYEDQVDGDILLYSIESIPSHGFADISAEGTLIYTPQPNYFGEDVISYRSCDSGNLCASSTITIEIQPVNDSPIVFNDSNELPINGSLHSNLQANVTDIDNGINSWSFTLTEPATHGQVLLEQDGSYVYTPEEFYYGEDAFTYTVCDNSGGCATGTVAITITLVNLEPEAEDASIQLIEDNETIISLESFTFDFGTSDLVFSLIEPTSIGDFNNITNVGFEFNPSSNLNGTFVINYRVCDTGNLCDSAQLSITIAPVNDSPLVNEGFITVAEDSSVEWLPEYSDIDSETLELSVLNPPSFGTLSGNTYIPNADFTGLDVFTYQVCDDLGACSSAIVEVTVDAVNDAPVALEDMFFGFEDSVIEDNVSGNDEDIDSNNLVFAALAEDNPYNISLDGSGYMQWLPPTNYSGTVVFHYSVCDNNGACDTASVTIEILEINDSPIADLPSINLDEDSSTEYASLNFAFDIEGQELYQSLVSSSGIEAALNPETGIITLSAANNYNGPAFVVVAICDVLGDCIIDTVQVEIAPVNDYPYGYETSFITYQDIAFSESWYNHVFDIDDTTLNFSATSHFGSIDVLPTGSFLFTPLDNFIGQDTIFLQACDSSNACVTLQYLISVLTPNQPPITQSAESTICQGTSAIFDLSQLVSDEADSAGELQYTFISNAPGTFLTNTTSQTLTVEPSPLFSGEMVIEMQVCDNASPSLCSTDTITLQVIATTTPIINEVEITSISCQGASDGSIHILDVLEETGVTFAWSNGSTDAMIENLNPGDYSVQINGLSECSESLSAQFTITEPQLLEAALNAQSIASELGGMIESSISGGTPPYSYSWSGPNGFTSENPSAVGLADPGEYTLVVTDAHGCQTIVTSLITSISETNLDAIHVYPNPATESSIYLQLASVIEPGSAITVYDACGRTVLSRTTSNNLEMLPTETWQTGIYSICIEHKLQSYLARVVVIK